MAGEIVLQETAREVMLSFECAYARSVATFPGTPEGTSERGEMTLTYV